MIIVISKEGEIFGQFQSYDDLFEHLAGAVDTELMAVNYNAKDRDWRFTIHPPQRVMAFFSHLKDTSEAIKESLEEGLRLIEICTSNYSSPVYIAQTPNVDMDYFKRKWCVDWCTFNHLLVREF